MRLQSVILFLEQDFPVAKRGPKPAGGYKGRTKVVSTRLTEATRKTLAASAKKRGYSFSHEIEHRLRASLQEDERLTLAFGGPGTYAIARLMAASMAYAGDVASKF